MSVSCLELLEYAKSLSNNHDEPSLRSSVVNAYYAVFLMAQDYVEHNGIVVEKSPTGGGIHADLIHTLSTHSSNNLKSVSYLLDSIKKKRIIASYQLQKTITVSDTKESISSANKIIEKLNQ